MISKTQDHIVEIAQVLATALLRLEAEVQSKNRRLRRKFASLLARPERWCPPYSFEAPHD